MHKSIELFDALLFEVPPCNPSYCFLTERILDQSNCGIIILILGLMTQCKERNHVRGGIRIISGGKCWKMCEKLLSRAAQVECFIREMY